MLSLSDLSMCRNLIKVLFLFLKILVFTSCVFLIIVTRSEMLLLLTEEKESTYLFSLPFSWLVSALISVAASVLTDFYFDLSVIS